MVAELVLTIGEIKVIYTITLGGEIVANIYMLTGSFIYDIICIQYDTNKR